MANTYQTSTGERFTQPQIEAKIKQAKAKKLQKMIDDFSFVMCEQCGASSGIHLDCSHDISVKKAKEEGKTEQCWNVGNITILCRKCHQKKDGLNTQFKQKTNII
ncbi:hypothetical protein RYR30_002255 [Flavobacterium psychrophilum]|uniref:hypothetical protein n=1 Tax=Flavobacterium psychrophilum TaxID=96345 RepID=UPI000B7C1576|nr:hypothetical protein [Flavobacterium psychrophilum]ELM3651211.1 hypothetical protein [Flavobacterium psychrophilum]ELM3672284.1 hypothetical protein [Flavobacterium psychrophilum]ELM3726832.1 hypothetical protein [Flavobacterium psychrophilum]SNA84059.1 hypothetical protein FI070_440011 [Flavobacterium psychrophilum]